MDKQEIITKIEERRIAHKGIHINGLFFTEEIRIEIYDYEDVDVGIDLFIWYNNRCIGMIDTDDVASIY